MIKELSNVGTPRWVLEHLSEICNKKVFFDVIYICNTYMNCGLMAVCKQFEQMHFFSQKRLLKLLAHCEDHFIHFKILFIICKYIFF